MSVSCRTFLFFTRCDVICDLLQYTHTRENVIYLLTMDNNRDNRGLLPEAHLHPAEFDNAVKV